jgi:hypothetical protein
MPTVLAIDPGPSQSAYVLWDGERAINREILPNLTMIALVSGVAEMQPETVLAIEKIACYGMAVGAEVFETCVMTGRFMQAWLHEREDTPLRIPRGEIKVHLCRSTKAKDTNVRQALIDRFGAPGTKNNQGKLYGITSHCWAALAVAVTAHDRLNAEITA